MPPTIDQNQCALRSEIAEIQQVEADAADTGIRPRSIVGIIGPTQRRKLGKELRQVGDAGALDSVRIHRHYRIGKIILLGANTRSRNDDLLRRRLLAL
ncbi:MAG TPA: hypothetical protein VGN68_05675 [Sphingopyxis sp.]|nr:hypothetical protein [Sphingopyxis sp.]